MFYTWMIQISEYAWVKMTKKGLDLILCVSFWDKDSRRVENIPGQQQGLKLHEKAAKVKNNFCNAFKNL